MKEGTALSKLIDRAIVFAVQAHDGQKSKGTDLPYIAHPFSVAMILMQAGCDEEVVAAGLLHDAVEDTPVTQEQIQSTFGERVSALVAGASEPDKSLSWEERKTHTLEYLRTAPMDVKMLACADKLSNARRLMDDLEKYGDAVWSRFNCGREQQLWYYSSLVDSLMTGVDSGEVPTLFEEYQRAVEQLLGLG